MRTIVGWALWASLCSGLGTGVFHTSTYEPPEEVISRDESGRIVGVAYYDADGKYHGENLTYYANGRLRGRSLWDHGQWIEAWVYHENGRLASHQYESFGFVTVFDSFDEAGNKR